ncbi:MAG: Methyltransferase domain [Rhodobacteraceae bacterium HLUCCO18]|nr:MAG: Methyltransferase domain [Rhodobacteraceae bacterium HLUCCO18]
MNADRETLAVYAAEAGRYAAMAPTDGETAALDAFLGRLAPGARILDIGCGPGTHARAMQEKGFAVSAWDASPDFVEMARAKGLDAHLRTFVSLTETEAFDAIWCSFSLLHTPKAEHPVHIAAMAKALVPGGWLFLGLKLGEGEGRDALGRFYSYVTRAELQALLTEAGMTPTDATEGAGKGLAGTVDPFILMTSRRDA